MRHKVGLTMLAETSAAYHYVWVAAQALLPVALGAFVVGFLVAWLVWGIRSGKGTK